MSTMREEDMSFNYPQICRACFDPRNIMFFESQHYIWKVFQDVTNIQFLHGDKPNYICHDCIQKLKDIAVYVDLCRTNDAALKQYILKKQLLRPNVPIKEIKPEIQSSIKSQSIHQNLSPISGFVKHEAVGDHLKLYLDEESTEVSEDIRDTLLPMTSTDCCEPGWNQLINETGSQSYEEEEPLLGLMKEEKPFAKGEDRIRPWHCKYCSKSFNLKHHLIGHLKIHSGIKPYQCVTCLRPFADRSSMNRHLKTHTGAKPYLCRICGHSFAEKYYLAIHHRSHSGEKPYSCDVCSKRFSRKDTLNMHLKTHTGEKPYTCTVCQKTFSFKHHLIIHSRNHNGERPFHCVTCSKSFSDRSSFNRHIKSYCRVNGNGTNLEKGQIFDSTEQEVYVDIKNDN
ncbi:gastrula zinc finger protein XlCGF57.1-like isoform X1 [Diorhabda carinulata]|uniref:gastrula zinc finger protein XlCGF57.1-like isoform X1 n=2 Tax=Diorhabda carinulata TaxID=1163345 RepID=UPI0025A05412|nr:gastrula zinc finger protein XlCGF57.1-like isoform X1 [Diorhabda carinulata]